MKTKTKTKTLKKVAKIGLGTAGLLSLAYAAYKLKGKFNDSTNKTNDSILNLNVSNQGNMEDKSYCLDIMPMNQKVFDPTFRESKRILKANIKLNMNKTTYEIITKDHIKFCGNFTIRSINSNVTEIYITSKKFSDYLSTLNPKINIESNKLLLSVPTNPLLFTNSRNNMSQLLSLILTLKKGQCNY